MYEVKEMEIQDVPYIVDYWTNATDSDLKAMGANISKVPAPKNLNQFLNSQIDAPYNEKSSYALIWLIENTPVGHCNVNKIEFGNLAFMHLHLWKGEHRKKGIGSELIKRSLPYFFRNLNLKEIFSEPYALNPAPNKTLQKVGFEFVKKYRTIPGSLNFEQEVNQWKIERDSLQLE